MTQCDQVLAHLATGAEITPLDALREYGIGRLASRIYDLRRDGVDIAERTVRQGRKHWSAYRLAFAHG